MLRPHPAAGAGWGTEETITPLLRDCSCGSQVEVKNLEQPLKCWSRAGLPRMTFMNHFFAHALFSAQRIQTHHDEAPSAIRRYSQPASSGLLHIPPLSIFGYSFFPRYFAFGIPPLDTSRVAAPSPFSSFATIILALWRRDPHSNGSQ